MPDSLQLYANRVRIQAEGTIGDGGDDSEVFDARLSGASFVRQMDGVRERIDPWGTREFAEPRMVSWGLELTGELQPDSLLFWVLDAITTAGAAERGMTVREIRANQPAPGTFALQFDGIDGTSTFLGCAIASIAVAIQTGRPITWNLGFAGLRRVTDEPVWAGTLTEGDGVVAATKSRLAIAASLGGNPDAHVETCYEARINIGREGMAVVDFSPDGVARGHTPGNQWDVVGSLLVPEISGITDAAATSLWNGSINVALDTTPGNRFEIEAPIVGQVNRRTGLAADWKQATFECVARRATTDAVARFIRDF